MHAKTLPAQEARAEQERLWGKLDQLAKDADNSPDTASTFVGWIAQLIDTEINGKSVGIEWLQCSDHTAIFVRHSRDPIGLLGRRTSKQAATYAATAPRRMYALLRSLPYPVRLSDIIPYKKMP